MVTSWKGIDIKSNIGLFVMLLMRISLEFNSIAYK